MNDASPPATVLDEVARWPGVTTRPTPRGAVGVVFDGHELGHVHPDRGTLDMPLPDERRAAALEAGRAKEWYSNWVSKPLADDGAARDGIVLLRESYDELAPNGSDPSVPLKFGQPAAGPAQPATRSRPR